jgi:hypothetical protein
VDQSVRLTVVVDRASALGLLELARAAEAVRPWVMSKVTGGLRRIASCHNSEPPMSSVVIAQAFEAPLSEERPSRCGSAPAR